MLRPFPEPLRFQVRIETDGPRFGNLRLRGQQRIRVSGHHVVVPGDQPALLRRRPVHRVAGAQRRVVRVRVPRQLRRQQVLVGGQALNIVRFNPTDGEDFWPGTVVSLSVREADIRLVEKVT